MSESTPKDNIVITHLPLTKDRDEVFALAIRSRALINTICQHSKAFRKKGVKVFERVANIIRTDEGYYCAFYESYLNSQRTQKKETTVKPFKGMDGRMKVYLTDKDGEPCVEDLATIVAKAYIPNHENFQFVRFKDGNPENCAADNLYWSEI